MNHHFWRSMSRGRGVAIAALLLTATAAATWLYAHEGHGSVPVRGVTLDGDRGEISLTPEVIEGLGVQTSEVATRIVEERLTTTARVVAPWGRHALASSHVAGRISELRVRPGEIVAAGQVLAEVESFELAKLQADLQVAAGELRLAEANLAALEKGADDGSISDQALLQARIQSRTLRDAVSLCRQKLSTAGLDQALLDALADSRSMPVQTVAVRSPLAGVVLHADWRTGQAVEPGQHLFEVVDDSTVWVELEVLERDLARVAVGQAVEVSFPGFAAPIAVTVAGTSSALEPGTQSGLAWAVVEQRTTVGRVFPGMRGRAEIVWSAGPAATIPATAVLADGALRSVLLETGPGQYQRKEIEVGRALQNRVELLDGGIYPGDRVVTQGLVELAAFFPTTVLRPSAETAKRIGLSVEPMRRRVINDVVEATGVVDVPPSHRAAVVARLPGTVVRLPVIREQRVQAGDVVAEVASLEYQELQRELLSARWQTALYEQLTRPLRGTSGVATVPTRQLREWEANRVTARLRVDGLRTRLVAAGMSDGQLTALEKDGRISAILAVRTPVDGVVVRVPAAVGQSLKGDDVLFEIREAGEAEIRATVAEADRASVTIGQAARVRLASEPNVVRTAQVVRIEPTVDAADRGFGVWLRVADLPTRTLHGASARVDIVGGERRPGLAAPLSAVAREGSLAFVFVRRADGRFDRRNVTLGAADDQFAEVIAGVSEGETVAVGGVDALQTLHAALR